MKEETKNPKFERRGESLSRILGDGFGRHVAKIALIVSIALLVWVKFPPKPAMAGRDTTGNSRQTVDSRDDQAATASPVLLAAAGRKAGLGRDLSLASLPLSSRLLLLPVRGISPDELQDSFNDGRAGGRQHHAIDIMAERSTPVVAVEGGTVAKIYSSRLGGLSVYQYDPTGRYVYYYAHLDRYAPGLTEGRAVRQGELIGYVGQTGNAESPHLHFAISDLGSDTRWWGGKPIDPYPLLRQARSS